jgi:hypothetical protein
MCKPVSRFLAYQMANPLALAGDIVKIGPSTREVEILWTGSRKRQESRLRVWERTHNRVRGITRHTGNL